MGIREVFSHPFFFKPAVSQAPCISFENTELERIKSLNIRERQAYYDRLIVHLHQNNLFHEVGECLLSIPDATERGEQFGLLSIYGDGGGIRRYMNINAIASQSLKSFTGEDRERFVSAIRWWNPDVIIDREALTVLFPEIIPEIPIVEDEMFSPSDEARVTPALPDFEASVPPLTPVSDIEVYNFITGSL